MARIARPEGAAEMRKRLLRAAYAAIAERGFDAVTLQEVADRAEVSKGLVLYYFKNKEQLLVMVMDRTDRIIRTRAEAAIRAAKAEGPRAQMEAYLGALTIGGPQHRAFYRVFLEFLSLDMRNTGNAEVRKTAMNFLAGCQLLEQEVIANGIAQGVFRKELRPVEAAGVIHALIDGLSLQWIFHEDEPFDTLRQRLHTAILSYLVA